MEKINFQENVFVGSLELNMMQEFSRKWVQVIGAMTRNFGFIELGSAIELANIDQVDQRNRKCFQLRSGGNSTLTINNPSYAISKDSNGECHIISWTKDRAIILDNSFRGNTYWVKISYDTDIIEKGSLKIAVDGVVTGTGTEFTSKLRGEPNYPSRIALFTYNGLEYNYVTTCIVESVNSDTQIVIKEESTGTIPATAPDYYYAICPTVPIATYVDGSYLYNYDGTKIEFLKVTDSNIPMEFEMQNNSESFFIAKITVGSDGAITIEDKRFIFEDVANDTEKIYSKWFRMK